MILLSLGSPHGGSALGGKDWIHICHVINLMNLKESLSGRSAGVQPGKLKTILEISTKRNLRQRSSYTVVVGLGIQKAVRKSHAGGSETNPASGSTQEMTETTAWTCFRSKSLEEVVTAGGDILTETHQSHASAFY